MSLHVVVVTGMSGAGRSTVIQALEDLGFFCVDNLPPSMAPKLLDLLRGGELDRVGLGVDVRTGSFLEGAGGLPADLRAAGHSVDLWFLDANDEALVRRYSETRRPHPLAPGGDLFSAIKRERERLSSLRAQSTRVFDTTRSTVHDLRRSVIEQVSRGAARPRMVTRVLSFGFKYGIPADADLVFDLRFLPNPYFVPELREKTGLEREVSTFVLAESEAEELLADLGGLLTRLLPKYEREGKAYLTVGLGCTGGKHRSVALAEELGRRLGGAGREIAVKHRDLAAQVTKDKK